MLKNIYVKRKIEDTVFKFLKSPEIIAVVGPRQCGKTTMLQNIQIGLPNTTWISFEDQKVLHLFEKDVDKFFQEYCLGKKIIFIDEFQYARHGGQRLKYLFDQHHSKFIITGSSAIDLTVKATKYLVGRILVFEMFPFDFAEFASTKPEAELCNTNDLLSEYALFGGYPRVVLTRDTAEKQIILKNIYNTYFLREVRDILGLIEDDKLAKLLTTVATSIGNLCDYNNWGVATGLSFLNLKKFLRFIEKTYVAAPIAPYFVNRNLEIVKNPKWYFMDTGLRNSVLDDFRELEAREDAGFLAENVFFEECSKNGFKIKFWRTKEKDEIDFIISKNRGSEQAVEIKLRHQSINEKVTTKFKKLHPKINFEQISYLNDSSSKIPTNQFINWLSNFHK